VATERPEQAFRIHRKDHCLLSLRKVIEISDSLLSVPGEIVEKLGIFSRVIYEALKAFVRIPCSCSSMTSL
jgi:phosphate starvation-inducible protein PhoH